MRISDWSSDVCSSGSEVAGIADGLARVALDCVELSTGSRTGPAWIAVAAVGTESDIRAEAVHRLLHRRAVRPCDVGQRQQVRSDERRAGIECVRPTRSRCWPAHYHNNININNKR